MADDAEDWTPDFKPGWPDLLPLGLIIGRSLVTQRDTSGVEDSPDDDDEEQVVWKIQTGVTSESPRLAFLADLTVVNSAAFGGVTVVMPFSLRDEPEDVSSVEFMDAVLLQYGEWVSTVMYDHAATVLRSALAGNGLPLAVPFGTPEVTLMTSDQLEDESATSDDDDKDQLND